MNADIQKFLCLSDELETSHKLIKSGFGALQEIDMGNDFYHLPHQLMASGFERLMKCYISLVYLGRNGDYPSMSFMRQLGHDLEILLSKIETNYYGGVGRELVASELAFLQSDTTMKECVKILSLFGRFGRYYNLDVVAGSPHSPIDPKSEWERLESTIEDMSPYLSDTESLYNDYYPRVHSVLIGKLERLARAIALQFTLGDHTDPSGKLQQLSVTYMDFRNMRDRQFGTVDYRQSVRILANAKENWLHRSREEILCGKHPVQEITESGFEKEWPFRVDNVIVECQNKLFAIVYIEGYAFALNGSAKSKFDFPFPHDAGLAVLGKSIGPFIDIALSLEPA